MTYRKSINRLLKITQYDIKKDSSIQYIVSPQKITSTMIFENNALLQMLQYVLKKMYEWDLFLSLPISR